MGGNTHIRTPSDARPGMPQWSRPVMGGNTRGPRSRGRGAHGAAMEPPGNGRKHPDYDRYFAGADMPQWSRPVMGGNTSTTTRAGSPSWRRRNGAAR